MLMYAWMVWMERAPERYDWAVKIMTLGRIDKIKREIAEKINSGDQVLDIGCGPGSLGILCLKKGSYFSGLDTSDFMLKEFKRKTENGNYGDRLTLIKDSVTQIEKHFRKNSLDCIVSTMAVGEFPKDYLDYIFKKSYQLLKPGGRLLIADEVWPNNLILSFVYGIVMGIMYLPQIILLRRVTCPIKNLKGIIENAGFHINNVRNYPFSTFQLVMAQK